uniref:Uncharacterized protein n=1 Tax=Arundo donax TaxID=35708 RepID=A0A0A9NJJ9_ARUDO
MSAFSRSLSSKRKVMVGCTRL